MRLERFRAKNILLYGNYTYLRRYSMGVIGARWKKARRTGLNANIKRWVGWVLESLAVMIFIGLLAVLTVGWI
jgi:hypothetical protein